MQQERDWDLFEEQLSMLQQIHAQKQAKMICQKDTSQKEQLRSEAKTNHIQCESCLPSLLKQSKKELILKLLQHLQCHQTKNAFQQQIRQSEGGKNPEEMSAIKRQAKIKKGKGDQKLIEQMVRVSSNYQELLNTLQQFYCQSDEYQGGRNAQWKQVLLQKELQKLIRSMLPQKRQATIPKYHNAEIKQNGKEVKLIDINSSEDIVLLDSEFYVHVIPAEGGDVKPFKLEKKKQIILLKWIHQNSFLLTNNRGRITVFNWNERQLTLRHQFRLQLLKIKTINICFDIGHGSSKVSIKILTVDQSSQFTATLLSIGNHEIKIKQSITFSLKNNYEEFNLLTNKQYGQSTLKYDHYIGLTAEQPSMIIKLDSFSKRQGVLWRPRSNGQIIKQIVSSKCKEYLYAFVCKRKKQLFSQSRYSFQDYQFIRMNEKGSCLQRTPLLLGDLRIYNCRLSLTSLTLLDPQWLCCLISDKNICYFSLVTGKLLFSHDIGKGTLSSIKSGTSNSIIYQTKNSYGLFSTEQRQMKKINLSKRQLLRDRESLILQLTMRNGIPQTLLQLLQQLRNNQYER